MEWLGELERTRSELNAVSPSFCLAKWLQVTLHLQNGFTHSCHHPLPHKVPLEELRQDPGALHNTMHKRRQRELMRAGARPAECAYCWKAEDAGGAHFSDRVVKSADDWARPRLEEIAALPPSAPVNPSYLEVSFGSLCNFRCTYCLPTVSSSIWQQYERHGAYVGRATLDQLTRAGMAPIPPGQPNPYVDAFWEWLPSISSGLRVLRVTGGEPLLSPHLDRLLDYFEAGSHPDLELAVNSNLGVPARYFEKFLVRLEALTRGAKLRKFMLYTSCDTAGAHAEYIRAGMSYEEWLGNLSVYLERTPWPAMVMAAFNVLSPPSFTRLLDDLSRLNSGFGTPRRVVLDVSHVSNPEYLSPAILDESWRERVAAIYPAMESGGFSDYEKNKMGRLVDSLRTPLPAERLRQLRGTFFTFTEQYEAREGRRFADVFPEMAEFHAACRASVPA